jgi:hypothetical protein
MLAGQPHLPGLLQRLAVLPHLNRGRHLVQRHVRRPEVQPVHLASLSGLLGAFPGRSEVHGDGGSVVGSRCDDGGAEVQLPDNDSRLAARRGLLDDAVPGVDQPQPRGVTALPEIDQGPHVLTHRGQLRIRGALGSPVEPVQSYGRQIVVAELDADVVGGAVRAGQGLPQFRRRRAPGGGGQLGDRAGQRGGGVPQVCGAHEAAQFIGRGYELLGRPYGQIEVRAEVVQIQGLTDRTDEGGEAVLLEFGHVGLSCQHGHIDSEGARDSGDEVYRRRTGSLFDLGHEAVGEGDTVRELPLCQPGEFALFLDACTRVVAVVCGHNGLRS